MPDPFTLAPFDFFVLPARTRFPFRYGIASMTDVPHLFVRTRVMTGNGSSVGLTAEGLPPKWFTKNPATTFAQDLPEMLEAIIHAADLAEQIAERPVCFFDLWRELDRQQSEWAASRGLAPLLAGLGVALVERAVLDGLCRTAGEPIHRMLTANRLGLSLGEIYAELKGCEPRNLLPPTPLKSCFVRHTVGLTDALSPGELTVEDRVDDGLPQDLEAAIRTYGLRYFKVKLSGRVERDLPRLRDLAGLLDRETGGNFLATVDGNENFDDFGAFRMLWERLAAEPALRELCRRTVVVEQPVHRDRALTDAAGAELNQWPDHPAFIIDESDGALGDVPRALELGYAGASYKNCKGIVKGLANACLLAARRQQGRPGALTGEDLCNLGPVALQQDLAMMALLGIEHVERNGHHYYRGLGMLPRDWQERALESHGDLYIGDGGGFARVRIHEGKMDLASVNAAPFGVEPCFDVTAFSPMEKTRPARIS
jgi:hypothetical protein